MAAKFVAILPHLDERQRRLLIGAEAQSLGHGGIKEVARAAGVREATVSAGKRELGSGEAPLGRVRRKTLEGNQHPDRDAQFHYLNEQARNHQDSGSPVISVDTKKKELVGPFKNSGREWEPQGEPVRVDTHDFPDRELGKAVPYGIYDVAANTGWVNVGTDHDTAAFAVNPSAAGGTEPGGPPIRRPGDC